MGIQERKDREKSERRKLILDAALKVYETQGYHATTMEKIAEVAELSRATLYLYFKTKDEIFTHAILQFLSYFGELLEAVKAKLDNNGTHFLQILWDTFIKFYQSNPIAFGASLYFHQGEMIRNLPLELREMLAQRGSMNYKILCQIVEKGIEMGYLVPDNPKTLAEVIWTSFLGIVHLEHSKKAMGRKSHLNQTCSLALKALEQGLCRRTVGQ